MNFDENIVITVEEAEEETINSNNDDNSFDINNFLLNNNDFNEDLHLSLSIDYMQNYTVKDLILICDYYGFSKEIKANKLSKELIIQCLVDWELDMKNYKIVKKRQQLWHYINELKNDKFMKKYVLW
jgi:uncharacterized protein YwgA